VFKRFLIVWTPPWCLLGSVLLPVENTFVLRNGYAWRARIWAACGNSCLPHNICTTTTFHTPKCTLLLGRTAAPIAHLNSSCLLACFRPSRAHCMFFIWPQCRRVSESCHRPFAPCPCNHAQPESALPTHATREHTQANFQTHRESQAAPRLKALAGAGAPTAPTRVYLANLASGSGNALALALSRRCSPFRHTHFKRWPKARSPPCPTPHAPPPPGRSHDDPKHTSIIVPFSRTPQPRM
jgi:hypothetical protein